jgi:hypothetical protein
MADNDKISEPPEGGREPDIEKSAAESQDQRSISEEKQESKEPGVLETVPSGPEPPYSIFSKWERIIYVYIASVAAFSSPVSSTIFYPAMLTLSNDLHVSLTKISLTITVYMVSVLSNEASQLTHFTGLPGRCSHYHRWSL